MGSPHNQQKADADAAWRRRNPIIGADDKVGWLVLAAVVAAMIYFSFIYNGGSDSGSRCHENDPHYELCRDMERDPAGADHADRFGRYP